jgi:predicted Zn-dependent peptidase
MAAWGQGYRHNQTHAAMKGDIRKAPLDEIQKCRDERFAVLSNLVVCAVGGLEPAMLLPAFSEKLGTLKSSASPVAPVKTHPQNRDLTWDLNARHLVLTWAIPSMEKDDYAASLLVAQRLNMQFFSDDELKKLTGMTLAGADLTTPEGNFFSFRHRFGRERQQRKCAKKLTATWAGWILKQKVGHGSRR